MRNALLVALAVASGATDALSFLALGRVFTSVMTGNLVLLGISLGSGVGVDLLRAIVAFAGYAAGVAAASRFLASTNWVPPALAAQLVLQAGVLLGWLAAGAAPAGPLLLVLIVLCGLAMGGQSAVVRALPVGGVSTTYLTGTLTALVAQLASGRWRDVRFGRFAVLPAVVAGALLETVLLAAVRPVAPALPLLLTAGVLGFAALTSGFRLDDAGTVQNVELWDAILSRRNVRSYLDRPIPPDELDRILEAGRRAPSSRNSQPWDFVVVTERDTLVRLAEVWQGAGHVAGSAATIALIAPAQESEGERVQYDLGQATLSMALAAVDRGIGSGHAAVADQDLARELLGFPEDRVCAYLIALGYPADRPLRPIRTPNRRSFEDVVHRERW